jgi:hypothetical protein
MPEKSWDLMTFDEKLDALRQDIKNPVNLLDVNPDTIAGLAAQFAREYERSEAHRRASTIIELATLSLLIDRYGLKVGEAAERIHQCKIRYGSR